MASGCYFGAIRWDAWYSTTGPAESTRRSLGPSQWQGRAPFFAQRLSNNAIDFVPTEATMTAEINFARQGGLSHWVFLLYDSASQMTAGYNLYQANPNKALMPWAMMRQSNDWGTTGNYAAKVAEALAQCQQAHYFKLPGNRPLVYIYYSSSDLTNYWGGSLPNFKAAIDAFRTACTGGGLGNPYIAVTTNSDSVRVGLGAEAMGAYISSFSYENAGNLLPTPYVDLDTDTRAYWDTQKTNSTGDVIPICMAGWDSAPRKDRPVPWSLPSQKPYAGSAMRFAPPTNSELTTHLAACVSWINANPTDAPQKVALIYAWNENDEGGWLIPSLDDPTGSRLTAIKSTIEF